MTLALMLTGLPGLAHEFWIEPEEYQVESGAPLVAHLRNGQKFNGSSIAYFERRTARFELIGAGSTTTLGPRMGDIPALDMAAPGPGLLVILHETTASTLKYTEWEKFQAFADHKDFPDIRARHLARGLPETGFTESYRRFAKALVAIGTGDGADAPTGMETEFVALANPYRDPLAQGMPVQLLYKGAPRADAQVEVFEKAPDGAVVITLMRSDADGRALIPVKPGHSYLIDAVVLREMENDPVSVWETLWAALTFAVPAN